MRKVPSESHLDSSLRSIMRETASSRDAVKNILMGGRSAHAKGGTVDDMDSGGFQGKGDYKCGGSTKKIPKRMRMKKAAGGSGKVRNDQYY